LVQEKNVICLVLHSCYANAWWSCEPESIKIVSGSQVEGKGGGSGKDPNIKLISLPKSKIQTLSAVSK